MAPRSPAYIEMLLWPGPANALGGQMNLLNQQYPGIDPARVDVLRRLDELESLADLRGVDPAAFELASAEHQKGMAGELDPEVREALMREFGRATGDVPGGLSGEEAGQTDLNPQSRAAELKDLIKGQFEPTKGGGSDRRRFTDADLGDGDPGHPDEHRIKLPEEHERSL